LPSLEEVERVVSFLKTRGAPDYIDEITEDDGAPLDPLAERLIGRSLCSRPSSV
jgi:DNA segregation ATPase FtsK/SpoIIIE-like protein